MCAVYVERIMYHHFLYTYLLSFLSSQPLILFMQVKWSNTEQNSQPVENKTLRDFKCIPFYLYVKKKN